MADTDALVRELDVYAPCALGGALTDEVVEVLGAEGGCGAANNQLDHPGIEKLLAERGILYAPDYCVNSGGLIQVADELEGFAFERASGGRRRSRHHPRGVPAGRRRGMPPAMAADRLAEQRIAAVASCGRRDVAALSTRQRSGISSGRHAAGSVAGGEASSPTTRRTRRVLVGLGPAPALRVLPWSSWASAPKSVW